MSAADPATHTDAVTDPSVPPGPATAAAATDPALAAAWQLLRERARTVRAGARDGQWDEAGNPVPSPCVSICRLDAQNRYCEGCLRTLDELRRWRDADAAQRLVVWSRLDDRLAATVQGGLPPEFCEASETSEAPGPA